jgi:hypothetical protein
VKRAGILVVIALLPVCTSSDVHEDPAGWTAEIPDGWHVLHFETTEGGASSTGTQISNVELPSPTIHERLPIQASGLDLPADGVAIVIATDDDPANVQSPPSAPAAPPLSMDLFAEGSSTGEGPSLSLLWFACDDEPLLLSFKQGPSLSKADRDSVDAFVRSISCSGADG